MKIKFNFQKSKFKYLVNHNINNDLLAHYSKSLFKKYSKVDLEDIQIHYNFVSSSDQIKMNKEFKHHNYNTDILTFDLSNNECELTGDVYISLKQVKKNATKYNTSLYNELNRVLIHGILHIIGFNDETKLEKKQMKKQENKFLEYINKRSTWNNSVYHY